MDDWDKATARLAGQAPWWEAGTAAGYRAQYQSHLLGELVRWVTGSLLKEFVSNEIAEPLDADFQIGARPGDEHAAADVISPPPIQLPLVLLPEDQPMRKTHDKAFHARKVTV